MTDETRIEQLLRDAWSPEPPDGLRGRVLRRAQEETAGARRMYTRLRLSPWKLALAGLGLALVVLSNLSDGARDARIAAMVEGGRSGGNPLVVRKQDSAQWAREVDKLLALASSYDSKEEGEL